MRKTTKVAEADNLPGCQRLDQWLWRARFFKTRALAAEAITGGRVYVNGQRTKPAKQISFASHLQIRRGHLIWEIKVKGVSRQRLSAPLAQGLYEESEESITRRAEALVLRKITRQSTPISKKRPTKRERRQLEEIKKT